MQTISFEQLPSAVMELSRKMDMLLAQGPRKSEPVEDPLLTIDQLMEYLPEKPARQTIYQKVFNREIPFDKFGKRLYFRRSAIDKWLANGRRV